MGALGLTETDVRLCEAIAQREPAMRRDMARFVAIPTGHNHTPGLEEFRGLVLERLRALGASARFIPGEPAPGWLWGSAIAGETAIDIPPTVVCERPASGLPSVLIASHLDTVFAPDDPFREYAEAADGRTATGPGVVDMKGGIVIALHALEALEAAGVACSWSYLFNSDEERGSYHSEGALRAEAPRHAVGLCTEPALPGGELAVERGGSGQFMIEARGRSAHVGREFDKGVSAVTALAEALVRVGRMPDAGRGRVVSVGPLEGGSATNVVPDRARAWGNVRYPDERIGREIAADLDALATPEGACPAVEVRRSFNRPPKPLTPAVERLAGLARDSAAALDQRLPFARTGGVCDGNILQQAGLPTIDTLGVRGGGLHTPQEWIDLSSLVERCQLLALVVSRIAAGALAGG
ncbi:MAG: M20 family peptidase [Planctomycetota bacterium]|nr:MAG: M20 family peptidase [Planctomycetota bacterium]